MPQSILEAIKMGFWDFEPEGAEETDYDPTVAMPGSKEKIEILASRAQSGLPLWHHSDQTDYDEKAET